MLIVEYPQYPDESPSTSATAESYKTRLTSSAKPATGTSASSVGKMGGQVLPAPGPTTPATAPSTAEDPIVSLYRGFLIDMEYAAKAEDLLIGKVPTDEEIKRRTRTVSFCKFL